MLQLTYHAWKHKALLSHPTFNEDVQICSGIWQNPTQEIFYIIPFGSKIISVRNPLHEIHVHRLRINLIMQVAGNLCWKWRFKPANRIHVLHLTAHASASKVHFCTHVSIQICLFRSHLPAFAILTYTFDNHV